MRMTTEVFVQLLWEVDLDLLFFSFSWQGLKLWPSGYESDLPVFCTLVKSRVLTGILIPSGFLA